MICLKGTACLPLHPQNPKTVTTDKYRKKGKWTNEGESYSVGTTSSLLPNQISILLSHTNETINRIEPPYIDVFKSIHRDHTLNLKYRLWICLSFPILFFLLFCGIFSWLPAYRRNPPFPYY